MIWISLFAVAGAQTLDVTKCGDLHNEGLSSVLADAPTDRTEVFDEVQAWMSSKNLGDSSGIAYMFDGSDLDDEDVADWVDDNPGLARGFNELVQVFARRTVLEPIGMFAEIDRLQDSADHDLTGEDLDVVTCVLGVARGTIEFWSVDGAIENTYLGDDGGDPGDLGNDDDEDPFLLTLAQDDVMGAIKGAAGGAVIGAIGGASAGGVGAGPGALAGAQNGAMAGSVVGSLAGALNLKSPVDAAVEAVFNALLGGGDPIDEDGDGEPDISGNDSGWGWWSD